jgi:alpha-1,6-mannosyltransferase
MSVHEPLGVTPQSGTLEFESQTLGSRTAVRTRLRVAASRQRAGLLALSGLLVCGLLISISASHTVQLLPETARPVPSWLAGPFGGTSIDLRSYGLIAVLVGVFACYALAVHAADRLSARSVLITIAGLYAVVLLAPPLLSTDVFSYSAYGRMGTVYGANPYLHGPVAIPSVDPLYPFIGAKWVTTPSAYGPLFTALSYVLAPLSIAASVLAYKAIAAVAGLVTVAAVWNAARWRGVNPVKAIALVGLNPLIVIYGVGGGHNDLLMLAAMVVGIYAILQHRDRVGGGLLAAATGIKLTAGLLLPFAIAGGAIRRVGRREIVVGAVAVTLLMAVLGVILFGAGPLHLPATIQHSQSEGDWHSIPGFITSRLGLGTIGHVTGYVLTTAFLILTCWLVRRVWRGQLDWIDGAGWATVAMLVTASSLLPWYGAWLMPLAALGADRRLWRTSIAMTGAIMLIQLFGYLPHGGSLGL